jgi:hypothetical protein
VDSRYHPALLATDAIMDRIVHNTIWIETGGHNMREHTAGQVTA